MSGPKGETSFLDFGAVAEFQRTWGFLAKYDPIPSRGVDYDQMFDSTIKEIGDSEGVTHQRAHQILQRAMRKLLSKAESKLGHAPRSSDELLAAFKDGPIL